MHAGTDELIAMARNRASTKLDNNALPDYYFILSTSPSASADEIKLAYHQALLRFHPDKAKRSTHSEAAPTIDIGLLKAAYETLTDPNTRSIYDSSSAQKNATHIGPRPAQVISLEDFEQPSDEGPLRWTYGCRCGGLYVITEDDMEAGQHLVGCISCSEVLWVGYELAEGGEH
ncbi:DnaJ-domain-containing protein [Laetiporus sulphureus 93-53]|uniref:Diphthamide biosynthesis protein 4 n=1 Tax=Laetiporus sulphureus 93-53 TaxID=1314785 RepID=A0A165GBX4_9APHY|nr:DnaJ-domain-containing protein [Laetiporus sulphureus 93-53]KZT10131.1 DnaJ-domain-containing protein [Laetiporus sulphureus 93-53]